MSCGKNNFEGEEVKQFGNDGRKVEKSWGWALCSWQSGATAIERRRQESQLGQANQRQGGVQTRDAPAATCAHACPEMCWNSQKGSKTARALTCPP